MIQYIKKLFSRQYRHKWILKYRARACSSYSIYKCKKCNDYKRFYFPELSLCSLSENEYLIKSILE